MTMGNSSSLCSDRNAVKNYEDSGSAVYPTAYNSHANSNGNTPQRNPQHQQQQQMQRQQLFKTTIPINEQQQQQQQQQQRGEHCQCQQTAGTALNTNNSNQLNSDVTSTQSPHPLCFCALPNNNNNMTTTNIALRSSHANKNHTTTPTATTTTSTTIEYELSNGIAKLTKISTSRNGNVEQSPPLAPSTGGATEIILSGNEELTTEGTSVVTTSNLPPLLTVKDLALVQANLQALSSFNLQQQQRANYSTSTMGDKDNILTLNACKRDRIGVPCTGIKGIPNTVSGLDMLKNKKYTKGKAFTIAERQQLGIHGLMPVAVRTIEEQVCCILQQLDIMSGDFERYLFLQELSERNEHLFYRVLATNITKMIPLVYTPTVGEACQKFSLFYHHNKGLFISIKDKGHVYDVLKNWPETDVRAIVVTDGERILGLGDLGANGMGIPIGKLQLYTTLGGIPPSQLLPITLDVGTNTKSILEDPFYIGIRQKRVTGVVYDEFIDEFMHACRRRFGQHCLIQFEDFGNSNAFRLLEKYRDGFCTFNDDIQGTASVALGGLFTSLKMTNKRLQDNKILFFGAGEAALGIANLCVIAMVNEGLTEEEAIAKIFLIDSRGLIVCNRPTGGLNEHKLKFAHRMDPIDTLEEAVKILKPSVLIGASAIPGSFTKEILKSMAENNDTPIIFALSNPTSKAECTAEAAYTYTQGRAIFASGSPFAPVQYGGKTLHPGMGNNAYIFPGVALGVLCAGMETIPEEVFLIAARQLSDLISADDLERGSLYPPLKELRCVSMVIAKRVMRYAYEKGLATVHPEPKDKMDFIKSQMYELDYLPAFPEVYGYGLPDTK